MLFLVLAGFFVGNALLAELIGGKLFQVPTTWHTFTLSCGVVLWPVVFIMTDIINEYFGRSGVRRLSILTACIITYAFVALWMTGFVKAAGFSPVDDQSFSRVFFQSRWIIVGSIVAFLLKVIVAIGVTPLLYVVHGIIDAYLGPQASHQMIEATAQREAQDHPGLS